MRKKKPKKKPNFKRIHYYYDLFQQPYDRSDATQVFAYTLIVEKLEEETGYNFKDTKDFKQKMKQWFQKHGFTGKDLKKARLKADFTQQELADKLGVSRTQITRAEKDERKLTKDMKDYIAGTFKESSIKTYQCVSAPLWYSRKINKERNSGAM